MKQKSFELYVNYGSIYEVLKDGPMLRNELADYLMDTEGKSKTTAYRDIRTLLENEDSMLEVDGDYVLINSEAFESFMEDCLRIHLDASESSKDKRIKQLESQLQELAKDYIEALESQQVIIKETISRDKPSLNPFDDFMLPWIEYSDYELDVMREQNEWTRESFFKELEDSNLEENPNGSAELNRDNKMKRGFIRTATEKLFKHRCKDTDTYNEMVEKTNNKEAVDKVVKDRKEAAAMEIASLKNISNSEKLALYACMGRYKNQEMESLLNLAGNKCINAEFLIRALENGDTINNYENMRDFIRQMAKPSEVILKQQFAEELIQGQWYVMAECNGKKKKYQLMPVDEYNRIKSIVFGEDKEEQPKDTETSDNEDTTKVEENKDDEKWSWATPPKSVGADLYE